LSLRASMSALKRDAAKVIAFTYVGGEDEARLEMTYRAAACRERARDLTDVASSILDELADGSGDTRKELEKIISLLGMLGRLGGVPNPSAKS
ncbi:MAG TPA: hypothetical protein VFY10_16795, partial [Dehalococcoidia bacterium]|nr:hypothetical protein [Dehalococcoidia bacterium]